MKIHNATSLRALEHVGFVSVDLKLPSQLERRIDRSLSQADRDRPIGFQSLDGLGQTEASFLNRAESAFPTSQGKEPAASGSRPLMHRIRSRRLGWNGLLAGSTRK